MIFRVGIENNNEGFRSIAWALEHPGCYAYGPDADQALDNLLLAIPEYAGWIEAHAPQWIDPLEPELILEETFENYTISDDFDIVEQSSRTVGPFFQYDWKPLTATDIEIAIDLLNWSRQDLQALLEPLTPAHWAFKGEGECWDVAGIVKHTGGAEWWYLERLGLAFPRPEVPEEPQQRLDKVRLRLLEILPGLEAVHQVVGRDGEIWSPRKLIRRAIWHERDHTDHLRKVLALAR